jgi:hypothetical protein
LSPSTSSSSEFQTELGLDVNDSWSEAVRRRVPNIFLLGETINLPGNIASDEGTTARSRGGGGVGRMSQMTVRMLRLSDGQKCFLGRVNDEAIRVSGEDNEIAVLVVVFYNTGP